MYSGSFSEINMKYKHRVASVLFCFHLLSSSFLSHMFSYESLLFCFKPLPNSLQPIKFVNINSKWWCSFMGGEVLGVFVRWLGTNQPGTAVMKRKSGFNYVAHSNLTVKVFEEKYTPKVPGSQKPGNEEWRLKMIIVGNIFQLLHE